MNRRLFLGTVLALAALTAPTSALAATDTLTEHQKLAVSYAVEAGIMTMEHGGLEADATVTRRDLVLMTLHRIYPNRDFGRCFEWIAPSLPIKYTKLFADVLLTDASAEAFCGAMVMGLISGQPDGSLKPDTEVSLAEAAKVISRGFGIYQFGRIDPPHFPWYIQYTDPLVEHGAMPEGLGPENACQRLTRAQVSEIFYALRNTDVTPDFQPARAAAMIEAANPTTKRAATPVVTAPTAAATAIAQVTRFTLANAGQPLPSRRQLVADALLRQFLASQAIRPVVVTL